MARVSTAIALILVVLLSAAAYGQVVRVTAEQTRLCDPQTKEEASVSIEGKRFMVYGAGNDWYLVQMTINKEKAFRWIPKADVEIDWGDAKVMTATVASVPDVNTFVLSNGTQLQFRRVYVPTDNAALAGKTLAWLRKALEGKQVTLEFDTMARNARGYGEAYVYVGGVCVNRLLVQHGLAKVAEATKRARYDPVLAYYAERAAKAKQGVWAEADTATSNEMRWADRNPASVEDAADATPRRLTPAQLTQWSLRLQVEVKVLSERVDLGDPDDECSMTVPGAGMNDGIKVSGPRPPEFDGVVPVG